MDKVFKWKQVGWQCVITLIFSSILKTAGFAAESPKTRETSHAESGCMQQGASLRLIGQIYVHTRASPT
eukprot:1150675-Pelagomonas_calceolata.AAC.5